MSSSLHLQLLTPWTLNCTDGTHSLHSRLHSDLLHYADLTTTLYYWLPQCCTLTACTTIHVWLLHSHYTDWIQLGRSTEIVSERSEQTHRKHRLRSIVASRTTSSLPRHLIGLLATAQQKTVSYCCAIATVIWHHLCMRRREGNFHSTVA
jgi:hypothetical protein